MRTQAVKEIIVPVGQQIITRDMRERLKAVRIATSIVVIVYDAQIKIGGMVHMALPDSKMLQKPGDSPALFVDLALPQFIDEMTRCRMSKQTAIVKIVGGSQLFNFGGGSGNVLNIGTRNAITARTILTREGLTVEKTETGSNKPRTAILEMSTGNVQVYHPGETPRYI